MQINQFIKVLERTHTYSADGADFDIIIDGWDPETGTFWGSDWEGNEYEVHFEDIDFENDTFYELTKIDVDSLV